MKRKPNKCLEQKAAKSASGRPVKAKYKPINHTKHRAAGSQPAAQSFRSLRNLRSTDMLLHGKSLSKVNLMVVTRTLPVIVTEKSTTISIAETSLPTVRFNTVLTHAL